MSVRVLRIIEIIYPNQEFYEVDRLNWYVPANGDREVGAIKFRGSTMLSETIGETG